MVSNCCVRGCKNKTTAKKVPTGTLSFHSFPSNPNLRQKWLQAIGRPDWDPPSHSRICSAHFSVDQLNQDGFRIRIKEEAIPVNALPPNSFFEASHLEVCRICLATDVKMFSLQEGILKICMETLAGCTDNKCNIEGLPQFVCYICGAQLLKCYRLIEKSMIAQAALLDIYAENSLITKDLVRQRNRKQLNLAFSFGVTQPITDLVCKHDYERNGNLNEDADNKDNIKIELNLKNSKEVLQEDSYMPGERKRKSVASNKNTGKPKHLSDNEEKVINTNNYTEVSLEPIIEGEGDSKHFTNVNYVQMVDTLKTENDDFSDDNDVKINYSDNEDSAKTKNFSCKMENTVYCDVEKIDIDAECSKKSSLNKKKTNVTVKSKAHKNKDVKASIYELSDTESDAETLLKIQSKNKKEKQTNSTRPNTKNTKTNVTTMVKKRTRKKPGEKRCEETAIEKLKCFNVLDISLQEQIDEWKKEIENKVRPTWTFICEVCSKKFPRKKTYEKHLSHHNLSRGDMVCPVCQERFLSEVRLKAHTIRMHSKRYECKECPKVFHNLTSARRHWEYHSGDVYRCGVGECAYSTRLRSAVWLHRQREHARDQHCARCGRCFLSAKGLATHAAVAHLDTEEEPKEKFPCEECDLLFHSEGARRIHILTYKKHRNQNNAEDPEVFNTTCRRCGNVFNTRMELVAHKNKEHPGMIYKHKKKFRGRPYPRTCEYCDKEMASRHEHYWHVRRAHKQEKYHPDAFIVCEQCGKGFQNVSLFRYHMSQHSGAPALACESCPRRFYHRAALGRHARVHTAARPHACPDCPRAFLSRHNYLRHRRKHTGETPYECSECNKKFKYWETLGLHVKHVHQKIPWPTRAKRGTKTKKQTKHETPGETEGSE